MAQTLEELFRTKQLPSQEGKTAKEAFDIQNSKDIRISSSDPFVNNTGIAGARLLRKTLGVRGSETLLEQEVVGIRIISGLSTPVIYGSESTRILLKTTPMLDSMKSARFGELSDTGSIGGSVAKARDTINSKLGMPSGATPTFVVNALTKGGLIGKENINLGLTQDRMNDLAAIRNSAEGSLLGKFLKAGGGGTLKTIGRQALGGVIGLGKKSIQKTLFGGNSRSKDTTRRGTILISNSLTGFTQNSVDWWQTYSINYGDNTNATPKTDPLNIAIDMDGATYSNTIKPDADTSKERNDLSYKQELDYEPLTQLRNDGGKDLTIRFSKNPERASKFPINAGATEGNRRRKYSVDDNFANKRGYNKQNEYESDALNKLNVYDGEGTVDNENKDFAPLKFYSVAREKGVQFRATITGLNETISPSWDSGKFIGSPFNYYTYGGVERSVSFNFKVFSLNLEEHKAGWDKINFLNSLVYPFYETETAYHLIPPFIKFTLGDMYKGKHGFIESLSHTFDDATPWEIDEKGYRLPMITDIALTIKFVESRKSMESNNFYTFDSNPQT